MSDAAPLAAPATAAARPALGLQLAGVGLFLFIPLVLFLFVRHPRPIAASLVTGVLLIVAHRFVARPYMERARARKCVWCNRGLAAGAMLELRTGGGELAALACPAHVVPARRFFAWLERVGPLLRVGIFVPLLLLLAALVAAATGDERWLGTAVPLFQLVVGISVNVAALGYLLQREPPEEAAPRVPFPAHNFFLLGVRALLWIFRLVGIWWIVRGAMGLLLR
jgi:hypothetical protein